MFEQLVNDIVRIKLTFRPNLRREFNRLNGYATYKFWKSSKLNCRNLNIENFGNNSILKVLMLVKYHPGLRKYTGTCWPLSKKWISSLQEVWYTLNEDLASKYLDNSTTFIESVGEFQNKKDDVFLWRKNNWESRLVYRWLEILFSMKIWFQRFYNNQVVLDWISGAGVQAKK